MIRRGTLAALCALSHAAGTPPAPLADDEVADAIFRRMSPFSRHLPVGPPDSFSFESAADLDHRAGAGASADHLSPVVFVSGFSATKVSADLNRTRHKYFYCNDHQANHTLWLAKENLYPLQVDCWMDDFELRWDVVSDGAGPERGGHRRRGSPGERAYPVIRERDVGVHAFLPGVRFHPLNSTGPATEGSALDIFGYTSGAMAKALGYPPELLGNFYFDFRRGPNEYAVDGTFLRLQRQIEIYYAQANRDYPGAPAARKRVVLMSASMGGPLIHQFCHWIESVMGEGPGRAWKDAHVERWISASGVFEGTSMITSTAVNPDDSDISGMRDKLWWVNWESFRDMMASWPGVQVMQPQFLLDGETIVRARARDGAWKNYTIADLPEVFLKAGAPPTTPFVYLAQKPWYFSSLRAPGVDVECIHGSNVTTPRSFSYENGLRKPPVTLENSTGDGVVNWESLGCCARWREMDGSHWVRETVFPGGGHTGELYSREGIGFILTILYNVSAKNEERCAAAAESRRRESLYV